MPLFENPFTKRAKPPVTNSLDKVTETSGVIPSKDTTTGTPQKKAGESDDPMLKFEELWQPNVDAKGQPILKPGPKKFTPQIDPKVMTAMMDKLNFTSDFSAEEVEGIKKGGDEAVAALASMINKATKKSFLTAFTGAQRMMEHSVQAARADALSEIPGYVKDQMVDSELSRENVLMSNPAYAPLVKSIKDKYQEKFPKASPAEINKGVRAYFDKMVTDMNESRKPKEEVKNEDMLTKGDPNADWFDWIDQEAPALVSGESTQNVEEVPQQTQT